MLSSIGMDNLFIFLALLQILVGSYLAYAGVLWLSYTRRRAATDPGFYAPRTAVICPCKGIEPGLEQNLTALCEFDHQNYEIFFVLASESDPAASVVKRRALLPEYFKELPPPTPKTGVSASFITPETGVFTHTVPGKEIAAVRRLIRTDIPNYVPRPKRHQELPPWTEDDSRRLGLNAEEARDGEGRTPVSFDPRRLRVVRGGGTGR